MRNQLEEFAEARRANMSLSDIEAAALSQAISLKRIADTLDLIANGDERPGILRYSHQ